MNLPHQLARHLRDAFYGGNWTGVHLYGLLADLTWTEALSRQGDTHSIAALTFHIQYYVAAVRSVLEGNPLAAHDQFSFDHPPIAGAGDWEALLQQGRADVEALVALVEALPEERLQQTFVLEKYGSYLRNLLGLVEHTHYHSGQIALLKKMLRSADVAPSVPAGTFA